MDLPTLEFWATKWRHAVVLFGTSAAISGYFAYYFSVKRNETKRLQFQRAAAILAICSAGLTALNFYYTAEITIERDRLTRVNEAELERFKLDKNREIKTLENENLTRREQIEILEKNNLKAAKEVANLQIEAAEAKRREAEAQTRLAKVEQSKEPRSNRFKLDLIVPILEAAPPGKAMVVYTQGNLESHFLAISLQAALQQAKWQNMGFKAVPSTMDYGAASVEGDIFFLVKTLSSWRSESVQALVKALSKSGYTVGGAAEDLELPDDAIRILVQPKP